MSALRCPVCKNDLLAEQKRYVCANNHAFDIARQGYVNLLLSSQRHSKAPGDSADMIADRHAFLEAGHYQPLRERIIERLAQWQTTTDGVQHILDLGCGEGYYTVAFAAKNRRVFALDIAKPALALAAKRSREITWCVGTSRALPFHDGSLDIVVNIFCRPHFAESKRALRENGVLLIAGPGPNHLRELREILYETVQDESAPNMPEDFALEHSETLSYDFALRGASIMQLARMTPHYWRAPQQRRAQLESIEELSLRAEFVLREFRITCAE